MKKVLTISERGELAQQLQHKDHFYTDIKLYNEFLPGSKLSSQLAKANEHNMPALHSRMLYDLLTKVDPEDVLKNRGIFVDETNVDDTKIDETKVDDTDVDETNVDETKVDETKVDETKVDETKVDEIKVDDTNVDETKVDETKVDETKVDETIVDETKVDDTKVDETKVDEVTNVPTTEETKEVAPVVEDEKKSVKKATNSPK